MCVVSMVGDHYRDKWVDTPIWPHINPHAPPTSIPADALKKIYELQNPVVSRKEFEDLKRDVQEMKALLQRAKKYDEANNEPHCEIDEKMDLLRRVAKLVDINLDDVLGK